VPTWTSSATAGCVDAKRQRFRQERVGDVLHDPEPYRSLHRLVRKLADGAVVRRHDLSCVAEQRLSRSGEPVPGALVAKQWPPDEVGELRHLQAHRGGRPGDDARGLRHRPLLDDGDERPQQLDGKIRHRPPPVRDARTV
jgi:hypothetical protein